MAGWSRADRELLEAVEQELQERQLVCNLDRAVQSLFSELEEDHPGMLGVEAPLPAKSTVVVPAPQGVYSSDAVSGRNSSLSSHSAIPPVSRTAAAEQGSPEQGERDAGIVPPTPAAQAHDTSVDVLAAACSAFRQEHRRVAKARRAVRQISQQLAGGDRFTGQDESYSRSSSPVKRKPAVPTIPTRSRVNRQGQEHCAKQGILVHIAGYADVSTEKTNAHPGAPILAEEPRSESPQKLAAACTASVPPLDALGCRLGRSGGSPPALQKEALARSRGSSADCAHRSDHSEASLDSPGSVQDHMSSTSSTIAAGAVAAVTTSKRSCSSSAAEHGPTDDPLSVRACPATPLSRESLSKFAGESDSEDSFDEASHASSPDACQTRDFERHCALQACAEWMHHSCAMQAALGSSCVMLLHTGQASLCSGCIVVLSSAVTLSVACR